MNTEQHCLLKTSGPPPEPRFLGLNWRAPGPRPTAPGESFRIVFLTDIHIQPERQAGERVAACLRSIASLPRLPDLILNGGDVVMDAVAAERKRADLLWDMWATAAREVTGIPTHYCIGNHDIWGWSRKSVSAEDDPMFGKAMMINRLGMPGRHYAFDAHGWRFIVLDSVQRIDATRYVAQVDTLQRAWLAETLAATPDGMPILVLSHIPVMGGASVVFANSDSRASLESDADAQRDWVIPRWQMHADAVDLIKLFSSGKNVRICLSGHTHVFDTLVYRDIAFINGGAGCGEWWRGDFFWTPPGYCILDIAEDGNVRIAYAQVE